MQASLKAQLTLAYNRFLAYADLIPSDLMQDLDGKFIEAYDTQDVTTCKYILSLMSNVYNDKVLQGKEVTGNM